MNDATRRIGRWSAALLVATAVVTGCTKDVDRSAKESKSLPGEVELVDWIGKVHEVTALCSEHGETSDDTLDSHGSLEVAQDHNTDVVHISGQGIEHCDYALDGHVPGMPTEEELSAIWPEGTAALEEWLDAMGRAHRSAVIVAAGNGDSRPLVSELFNTQHEADHLADELEGLVAKRVRQLDLEWPDEGLGIHRWEPPAH